MIETVGELVAVLSTLNPDAYLFLDDGGRDSLSVDTVRFDDNEGEGPGRAELALTRNV